MPRGKYTPEFKAKIVLEVLQGERELGAIAAENSLNPNMVRNWKAEFAMCVDPTVFLCSSCQHSITPFREYRHLL